MEVNIGILAAEVLITLVRFEHMTGHDNFNPSSVCYKDYKLITLEGMKWGH